MYGRADGMPSFQLTVAVCDKMAVSAYHIGFCLAGSTVKSWWSEIIQHDPQNPFTDVEVVC